MSFEILDLIDDCQASVINDNARHLKISSCCCCFFFGFLIVIVICDLFFVFHFSRIFEITVNLSNAQRNTMDFVASIMRKLENVNQSTDVQLNLGMMIFQPL